MIWKSPQRGYAVGREGEIFRSTDGGATWKALAIPRRTRARRIAFVDPEEGWAVGDGGLILHTVDGGDIWTRQEGAGRADLTVIQMISAKTGWIGGEGVLLGTRDAGQSWRTLRSFPRWQFVSGRRGYASDGAAIYRTKDGGEIWKRIWRLPSSGKGPGPGEETPPSGSVRGAAREPRTGERGDLIADIRFVDRYNGIAETLLDGKQAIFRTRSLGRVWKRVHEAEPGSRDEMIQITLLDGRHALAIDAEGSLRATGDGGRTWSVHLEGRSFDLTDVDFADSQRGWAVSRSGRVLVTHDGGGSWREIRWRAEVPLFSVRVAPAPSGQARAWAAGAQGSIVASGLVGRPGRRPWRRQATPARARLRSLDFADLQRGMAVGDAGIVLATEDGGATWARRDLGIRVPLRAVAFADRRRVLIGGASTLLGSVDGGESFRAEPAGVAEGGGTVVALAAPDPLHLFALQEDGELLRSADGGERWSRVRITAAARLLDMSFADPSHGWVLGRRQAGGSSLYLTTDGGLTWLERELPARDVSAIYFAGREKGWIVGPQTILVSTDGGLNWRRRPIGPSRFVRAFTLSKEGGGWAVGDTGFVARYEPPGAAAAREGGTEEGSPPR
jgi:photosystem II stability/assembly factor-like uncharacterized protein